jgi:hypothetical protein
MIIRLLRLAADHRPVKRDSPSRDSAVCQPRNLSNRNQRRSGFGLYDNINRNVPSAPRTSLTACAVFSSGPCASHDLDVQADARPAQGKHARAVAQQDEGTAVRGVDERLDLRVLSAKDDADALQGVKRLAEALVPWLAGVLTPGADGGAGWCGGAAQGCSTVSRRAISVNAASR